MGFNEEIKEFASSIKQRTQSIKTEEATKMSLVLPFFQKLGYDVFNPAEFCPEYTADVGIKKGEKVDYAILDEEGNPSVLIECKWCGDSLEKHGSQLFRYFSTTTAKFGILTNGIIYKFYVHSFIFSDDAVGLENKLHTILNDIKNSGGKVIAIGKIEDIFSKSGITHAIHTGSNREGLELTLKAVKNELDLESIAYPDYKEAKTTTGNLIFTNLVDTDMLYGHRNDPKGYGKAIEEIDTYVDDIIENMTNEDLLIITADHGCDPTVEGTDHTREKVPVLVYSKNIKPKNLGAINGFDYVAKIIKEHIF